MCDSYIQNKHEVVKWKEIHYGSSYLETIENVDVPTSEVAKRYPMGVLQLNGNLLKYEIGAQRTRENKKITNKNPINHIGSSRTG